MVHRVRVQREAVAALRKAGVRVEYDWKWGGGNRTPIGKSRGPKWLVDRLGVDFFDDARVVYGSGANFDDALIHVGKLGWLEVLDLRGTTVTDAGLAHIEGLTQLEFLALPDRNDAVT